MIIPLLVGIVVGFLMGIPIGPINVWVMKTKITHGRGAASTLGFAGALMDGITVFFILSGLSLFKIPTYFIKSFHWLGVVVLIFLGLKESFKKLESFTSSMSFNKETKATKNKFLLGVVLYLSNPSVLITLTGLIAFIKSLDFFSMKGPHGVVFSAGTGVGVFLWFLCLIKIVDRLESKLGQKKLFQLNRLCGFVILALGVYLIYLLSFGKSF